MDEVPTQAPDFIVSLSIAPDSDLTANLSLALRAARVNAACPSEAAVRAVNTEGGVPHRAESLLHFPTRQPAPIPMATMGFAPPALAKGSGDSPVKSKGQESQQSPAPVLAPHPPLSRSPFPS